MITLIYTTIKSFFKQHAAKFKIVLVIFFITNILLTIGLYNKSKKLDNSLGQSLSNMKQYQSLAAGYEEDNRVLNLTIADFKSANDSLINIIKETQKELKIKDKDLKLAAMISTVIRDTTVLKIPVPIEVPKGMCDFNIEFKPNALTTYKVSRVDGEFTHIDEIYNRQFLYVEDKKEYRNERKNFFSRLIHLDFKKDRIKRYSIKNDNDKINVLETRVIEISK